MTTTTQQKSCRVSTCGVPLVAGENWTAGRASHREYICRSCGAEAKRKYRRANPEATREAKRKQRTKNGALRAYVLVNPAWPAHCKIGVTTRHPTSRLAQYNIGCPAKAYRYAALATVADPKSAEDHLLRALSPRALKGEWLRVDARLAVALLAHLSGYGDDLVVAPEYAVEIAGRA